MNVEVSTPPSQPTVAASRQAVADCDIHPAVRRDSDLHPWLAKQWRDYLAEYGGMRRVGMESGPVYPKGQPNASRRDAYPPEGGRQGSSLSFMQQQHLDANNVTLGILNPLKSGQGLSNPDLAAAMCRAVNEWQVAEWTSKDSRLKASIVVPYDHVGAAAEIRHWDGHKDFVQVLMLSRTADPLGNRRYWPIYEAASERGLPVSMHAFGYGGPAITSSGWPSHYIEEMTGHAQNCQGGVSSLILEGVFEQFPTLKVIMVEAGFAWAPPLAWRLDKAWKTLRSNVLHVKQLPSETMRRNIWWTTQPMEEPEPREHLRDTIEWMGWDRLLFASDYPHWDFDDPAHVLPLRVTEQQRHAFFQGNARAVYGITE
jgi:uncharacterized protein